ncbi:unnamed protein product, partial [Iphiclides podalirius]
MDDRIMESSSSSCHNHSSVSSDHPKSIIHIDIDCFYAQVEMLRKPELRSQPLGIQQKNIVVTSNYEARKFGIKKCMLVTDAQKVCPSLKLVNGEDLHNYRAASNNIFAALQYWKCPVEKLGLAFTKFQERMTGRGSIVNYLMNDISVQSVLNITNDCDTSASSMDYSAASPSSSTTTDLSDGEVEPSPKKPKKVNWIAKRRCLSKEEVASPSKLKVGELRLNSRELEKVSELRLNSRDRSLTPRASPAKDNLSDTDTMRDGSEAGNCDDCPSYVDKEVFKALPDEMQQELKAMWKNPSSSELPRSSPRTMNKSKPNTILKYFVPHK